MKSVFCLIFIMCLNLIGSALFSQQVYFNSRYSLNTTQAWNTANNIVEVEGGYLITGGTVDTIYHSMRWLPLTKVSSTGELLWIKYLGDFEHDFYPGWAGSLFNDDSDIFLAGNKIFFQPNYHPSGLLVKFTQEFDTLWTKVFKGDLNLPYDSNQHFNNMDICEDGSFIFTGELYFGQQPSQMVLLKADTLGNQQWVKYFGTPGLNAGYSVIQTSDDGFAIGGFWYIPGSSEYTGDPIVIKTDSLGNKEWEKNLGGPHKDNKAMLCKAPDGSIIVGTLYADSMSGPAHHGDPFSRIHIVKLDNSGNIIWDKLYGSSDYKYNYLTNIRCLDDGSVIACGHRPKGYPIPPDRSGWIMKISSHGDSLWYRYYEYLHGDDSQNYLKDIIPTSDNGFLACGYVFPMQPDTGTQDAWVIKLDSMGCDTPGCATGVGIENPPSLVSRTPYLYIFPNPTKEDITIRYRIPGPGYQVFIYDMFGRKQDEILIPPGQEQVQHSISDYAPGIYVAVLKGENGIVARGKFIKSGNR